MRDVLAKMRECGKDVKMRDFPHDCGMVDTYAFIDRVVSERFPYFGIECTRFWRVSTGMACHAT